MLRKSLIACLMFAGLATPAFAQEAPEAAYKDFWCGTAFSSLAGMLPPDAAEEDRALAASYTDGGAALLARAMAAYAEAGFTEEQISTTQTELSGTVIEQVSGTGESAEFTFDECAAVLPTPLGAPAEDAPEAQ